MLLLCSGVKVLAPPSDSTGCSCNCSACGWLRSDVAISDICCFKISRWVETRGKDLANICVSTEERAIGRLPDHDATFKGSVKVAVLPTAGVEVSDMVPFIRLAS